MMMIRNGYGIAAGVALCLACGDAPPSQPSHDPTFGVSPNPSVVEVQSLSYPAGSDGIIVICRVNRGVFQAAQRSPAGFAVELSLSLGNADGQLRQINPNEFPLADAKVVGVSNRDVVPIEVKVAWDGNDESGKPMAGVVTASFKAQIVLFPNGEEKRLGQAAEGTLELDLPAVQEEAGSALVGLESISYDADAGVLVAIVTVNRGIFEAAQHSAVEFAVEVTPTIEDALGRVRQINPDNLPLVGAKVLGVSPNPSLVAFEASVGFDGTSDTGEPMSGTGTVTFKLELVSFPDGQRQALGQAASGTAVIELPAVQSELP